MSQLTLLLLGPPRLEYNNQPVEIDTRKAIALLAYLALTEQQHSRDALAALLWPDYGQTSARAALRRTLSALKKALGNTELDADRERVGLGPSTNFWIDVHQFRNLLAACRMHGHPETKICPDCRKPLTEAVALYRDDFMAGFTLRDSPNFDDWQYFQAEAIRQEFASALERLVHLHVSEASYEIAITYARRWLQLDPLHEPVQRALMQVYAWSGRRAAALHQYRECVRLLQSELGVAPLAETTNLYEAIKNNQLSPPARQTESSSTSIVVPSVTPREQPPISSHGPLVGRTKEWATLLATYTAITTNGHLIVLEGEAGIGKTRLAEEVLTYARAQGAATMVARCYAGETHLAYGPFIEGLTAALEQPQRLAQLKQIPEHWLMEAARLVPRLEALHDSLPPASPLDTLGAQARFFEGITEVLTALCSSSPPGVLFFDDLHWADTASLDLFTYLVRRLRGRPLCLLVTWRSEQVPSDHRLRDLLAEAKRASTATVLPLQRLHRSAVIELVQSVTDEHATSSVDLGQRLYAETEGLPLFLTEYLAAITQGALPVENTDWSLPHGVRGLLQGRLRLLSQVSRQVLNTAAVIGRSFDFDSVRESSGCNEDEIVTALEELTAHGLVEEVRVGVSEHALLYDFSHEKLRALVYDEISQARRRLLHRRVAETLALRTRTHRESDTLFSQIARQYQLAGQAAEAAEYYKRAGEHARALYANTEALAHFRSALSLGHPDTAALHEAIADMYTLLGDYGTALTSYKSAIAIGDPDALANVEHKLAVVYQRRGEWELAERHLQAALAALGGTGPAAQRARLYADWSLVAHQRGETGEAFQLAGRALELAETAGDTRALAEAHNRLGILATSQRNLDQARYHLQQSLELAESLHDPSARTAALNNLALAFAVEGETEQAIKLTEAALALCVAQGDRHREAALHNNLADLLYATGQSEAAMRHLKQAVAIYADIGVEAGAVQPAIWKLTEW
jgi:DNA-binding SARP family transcriptional activator/Tfp pilus assembly protein PilF